MIYRSNVGDDWQSVFLEAYAEQPVLGVAARRAGVESEVVRESMERDPGFAAVVQAAEEVTHARLELILEEQARNGDKESEKFLERRDRVSNLMTPQEWLTRFAASLLSRVSNCEQ